MNKKIMMSGLSIISALTLLGGTAFAAFTTTATTTGNTFSTTNPNLQVNTGSGYANTTTGFTETNLVPGGTPTTHNFSLFNSNTGPSDGMTLSGLINPTAGDPSLESSLYVRVACDNGTDTGYVVMSTWMNTPQAMQTLAPNASTACTLQVQLQSGNTTDANKSITFDMAFSGTQGN